MQSDSVAPAAIRRTAAAGLDLVLLSRHGLTEGHLTLRPRPGEAIGSVCRRFAAAVEGYGARVLKQTVFGNLAAHAATLRALSEACGGIEWPVTWIGGGRCQGDSPLAGMVAQVVAGTPVETLRLGERVVGRAFHDGYARHCYLGNLRPDTTAAPRTEQAYRLFENLEAALGQAGMQFSHVARTWLYLDQMLAWYGEFNQARTRFFNERGVFERMVPASTGIGGPNPAGAAILAEAYALQSEHPGVSVQAVSSPLQCPAPRYGSAFSRAAEVCLPDCRRLLVSGTASIAPGGESVHLGDIDGQVDLTLRVVDAILQSRRMSFRDVTRAVAYFKHAADAAALVRYGAAHGLTFPVVYTQLAVCRDELLFEIELDAVNPNPLSVV